jgi:hypothetical protein
MQNLKGFARCLWFDHQAEDAVNFYCGIFKNSKITRIARCGHEGPEIHGRKPGTAANIAFELDGHSVIAINGGPLFTFNEFRYRSIAAIRTKSITTAKSLRPMAANRAPADGRRTSSASPGRSYPAFCPKCFAFRIRRRPIAS